jgi:hypothetical protein
MAPPLPLLVLQVKKEEDSTSKHVTEVLQNNAPPELDEVMDLNKQFETWTFAAEGVCLCSYKFVCKTVGLPVKKSFHAVLE